MFYAPVLFKTIGFSSNASLLSAVITGLVNVLATFVSIFNVDRVGRKFLFMEGGVQMFISQQFLERNLDPMEREKPEQGNIHIGGGLSVCLCFSFCMVMRASWMVGS